MYTQSPSVVRKHMPTVCMYAIRHHIFLVDMTDLLVSKGHDSMKMQAFQLLQSAQHVGKAQRKRLNRCAVSVVDSHGWPGGCDSMLNAGSTARTGEGDKVSRVDTESRSHVKRFQQIMENKHHTT